MNRERPGSLFMLHLIERISGSSGQLGTLASGSHQSKTRRGPLSTLSTHAWSGEVDDLGLSSRHGAQIPRSILVKEAATIRTATLSLRGKTQVRNTIGSSVPHGHG